MRRTALALTAAGLSFACPGVPAVQAQSVMRSPNLNIQSRMPTINPTVTPRINPNHRRPERRPAYSSRIGVTSTLPECALFAESVAGLQLRPSRQHGECQEKPVASSDGGGAAANPPATRTARTAARAAMRRWPRSSSAAVANEFVAEIDGSLSDAQADALARRHGLVRVAIAAFSADRRHHRPVPDHRRPPDREGAPQIRRSRRRALGAAEPPSITCRTRRPASTEGDPAQYALAKLRLPQAHTLASGANVTIAVIDSGIDDRHPELLNSIADNFDALGSKEGPHVHGTGIAGAIVSHARLMGSAPQARILGIRAFGTAANGAESTTFVILKALNYAVLHGAQIINMSFAGPKDPLIERGIGATAARGIVMVAASGNAGAEIAAALSRRQRQCDRGQRHRRQDKLFAASNRGGHIAVAAPGVDIFLPAPDEKYQMTSGTSFSAAYVSGLVALMLERNPALKPGEVRAILMRTARDLGSPGRDDQFGAGAADAFAAVSAVTAAPAVPVAGVSPRPPSKVPRSRQQVPPTRALNQPAAAMASDKSAAGAADRPAAQ